MWNDAEVATVQKLLQKQVVSQHTLFLAFFILNKQTIDRYLARCSTLQLCFQNNLKNWNRYNSAKQTIQIEHSNSYIASAIYNTTCCSFKKITGHASDMSDSWIKHELLKQHMKLTVAQEDNSELGCHRLMPSARSDQKIYYILMKGRVIAHIQNLKSDVDTSEYCIDIFEQSNLHLIRTIRLEDDNCIYPAISYTTRTTPGITRKHIICVVQFNMQLAAVAGRAMHVEGEMKTFLLRWNQ